MGSHRVRPSLLAVLPLLTFLLCSPHVKAQVFHLSTSEKATLAKLVSTDSDARKLFHRLKNSADHACASEPNPAAVIRTAGLLAQDPAKVATQECLKDMAKLEALAIVFAVTNDPIYKKSAERYLVAWAKTDQPSGRPIDETNLGPLLFAYDIFRSSIDPGTRHTIDEWLETVAKAEIESRDPKTREAVNNWNSHRLKIVALIGFVLEDHALINYAVTGYKQQISENLRADGSSLDFEQRDAIAYHTYDLVPLLTLTLSACRHGMDLYGYAAPSGSSLPRSIGWLIPYVDGRKVHPEYVNTTVRFDLQRAANQEPGHAIGANYDPRNAVPTLELAAAFDPRITALALKVRGSPSKYPSLQLLLNAVVGPCANR